MTVNPPLRCGCSGAGSVLRTVGTESTGAEPPTVVPLVSIPSNSSERRVFDGHTLSV